MGRAMFIDAKSRVFMLTLPIVTKIDVEKTWSILEQLEVKASLERILANKGLLIGITPSPEEESGERPYRVYPEI